MTTIRLVPLGEEHVPALLETMRDPEVLRFTRTPDPMPEGWIDKWLLQFDGDHRVGVRDHGRRRLRRATP